ncbi:hypothetical protein HK104_010650 [Borealophlyctis nickersoniae]|nr:hypothetical protein HK104_010650 [Borealophlyctis nickersoniae]
MQMTPEKRRRLTVLSKPPTPVQSISTPSPPSPLSLLPTELIDYIIDTQLIRTHTYPTTPENKSKLKALRLLRHRTKNKAERALSSVYGWNVHPNVYEAYKIAKDVEDFGARRFQAYSKEVMKLYLIPHYQALTNNMEAAKCCMPRVLASIEKVADWQLNEWKKFGQFRKLYGASRASRASRMSCPVTGTYKPARTRSRFQGHYTFDNVLCEYSWKDTVRREKQTTQNARKRN